MIPSKAVQTRVEFWRSAGHPVQQMHCRDLGSAVYVHGTCAVSGAMYLEFGSFSIPVAPHPQLMTSRGDHSKRLKSSVLMKKYNEELIILEVFTDCLVLVNRFTRKNTFSKKSNKMEKQ